MPKNVKPITHTGITAGLLEKSRRHARPTAGREVSSVNVQAVISGSAGNTTLRGLAVGDTITHTVPLNGFYATASPDDLTVGYSVSAAAGSYEATTTVFAMDPITGDYAYAFGSGFAIPASGQWPPTSMSSIGLSGTTFSWSGTGYRRATDGPVTGWVECVISRTA